MTTIIALLDLAPFLLFTLLAVSVAGVFACYKLATRHDRIARISVKIVLFSAALVPALAYVANNYWISIHNSAERLALHAVPMNQNHLEAMYFLWWCFMSVVALALYIWRKRRAA